jgi:hypothetical protein
MRPLGTADSGADSTKGLSNMNVRPAGSVGGGRVPTKGLSNMNVRAAGSFDSEVSGQ